MRCEKTRNEVTPFLHFDRESVRSCVHADASVNAIGVDVPPITYREWGQNGSGIQGMYSHIYLFMAMDLILG